MVDLSLMDESVVLTRDIDNVLQQIDMLFDTNPHEVLGDPSYGSNFNEYIWDLKTTNYDVEEYVNSLLHQYVNFLGYECKIQVQFLEGNDSDIILISIELSRDGEQEERTYKITGQR